MVTGQAPITLVWRNTSRRQTSYNFGLIIKNSAHHQAKHIRRRGEYFLFLITWCGWVWCSILLRCGFSIYKSYACKAKHQADMMFVYTMSISALSTSTRRLAAHIMHALTIHPREIQTMWSHKNDAGSYETLYEIDSSSGDVVIYWTMTGTHVVPDRHCLLYTSPSPRD